MARLLGIALAVLALATACGVRSTKPFTAKGSVACLRSHGFTKVTTNPNRVGFIAAFADLGGIVAKSASGNVLTIAFASDPSSTGSTEEAFRSHAPKRLRPHMSDIMEANRNAVLVWTTSPRSDELAAATGCLKP